MATDDKNDRDPLDSFTSKSPGCVLILSIVCWLLFVGPLWYFQPSGYDPIDTLYFGMSFVGWISSIVLLVLSLFSFDQTHSKLSIAASIVSLSLVLFPFIVALTDWLVPLE